MPRYLGGVPPDDTMRTPAEIAAGENHSSGYFVQPTPPIEQDPVYKRQLERERIERINKKPVTRVEFEELLRRFQESLRSIEELEAVVLKLASRIAAQQVR